MARVDARYALFQTDGANWMIHRMDPAPEGWQSLPALVRPMLAVPGDLPATEQDWSYEFKWDGVRAVGYVDGGRLRLITRSDRDCTGTYPELRGIGEVLGARQAVLDGEIIALDAGGRPSFEALQPRINVVDVARARRLAQRSPVTFVLFDLLYLDGVSTVGLSYLERRRLLESLGLEGERWNVPATHPGPGADLLAAARSVGLEGVVAKRSDSPYRPGQRSGDWVKVKVTHTQEVLVGGWTPGKGERTRRIGALLVGVPGDDGLEYVGKVGTGFTEASLDDLQRTLEPLRRPGPPFTRPPPAAEAAGATWVEPELVGEVRFTEWTRAGRLRQAVWRGLRPDKMPTEVVRES